MQQNAERPSSPALHEGQYALATRDKHDTSMNFRHVHKRPVQRLVRPLFAIQLNAYDLPDKRQEYLSVTKGGSNLVQ